MLEKIRRAWKQAKDDSIMGHIKRYPVNILEAPRDSGDRWELDCRICGNLWYADWGELKWIAMVIAQHFSPHTEELG